jgi:hypothetical protein
MLCRQSEEPNRFKCAYPGCKYRGSFSRVYDLTRHMKKHNKERELRCPVVNCGRSFHRTDKLRDHLKSKKNHSNDELASCVHPDCDARPMTLDLLKVHSINHKTYRRHAAGCVVASLWKERCCPLPSCPHSINHSNMVEHIRIHLLTERKEAQDAIEVSGYNPLTGDIICPLCRRQCQTTSDFEEHLGGEHLANHLEYLLSFVRYCSID